MSVLIVGGAGFVGNQLAKYYLDNNVSTSISKLADTTSELSDEIVYNLDLLDMNAVVGLLNKVKPDYICNMVALSSVALCWKNPQLAIDINIKGSVNLFEAVRLVEKKPRILIIGSGEEYGESKGLINEQSELIPTNIYGATKVAAEILANVYEKAYGLDIILTRSFNQCGPFQPTGFVIADFCKQVALIEKGDNEPIIKVGNLNVSRDFLDVRDAVKAYATLFEKGKKGEVYNVASGISYQLTDILNKILSKSNRDIDVFIDKDKFRPVDSNLVNVDISKIKNKLRWKPLIDIEKTLDDTLNYWRGVVNL